MHKCILILLTILQVFSSINGIGDAKKVVCNYFGYGGTHLKYMLPEEIDANVCTHISFWNGVIDTSTEEVKFRALPGTYQAGSPSYAERLVRLKEINPDLKLLLLLSPENIPWVLETPERKAKIITSAVSTLNATGFDGLDFQSPELEELEPLATFFCELKKEFDKHGYIVSTAAPISLESNAAIDAQVEKMSRCCSIISLLISHNWATRSNTTRHYSPMNLITSTVDKYIDKGYPVNKLLISVPTWSFIVNLSDPKQTGLGASASGGGNSDSEYTERYHLFNSELVKKLNDPKEGWTFVRDEQSNTYAYSKTGKWVSLEDATSAAAKARYVLEKKLGGVLIFTLDMESYDGTVGPTFPIIRSISDTFKQSIRNNNTNL